MLTAKIGVIHAASQTPSFYFTKKLSHLIAHLIAEGKIMNGKKSEEAQEGMGDNI